MVLVQKWSFFQPFFLGSIGQENVFTILQNQKTPFQAIKTQSSKSQKIDIFPCFWSKNGHFSHFSFQGVQGRKICFTILQNQKTPFQAIKTQSSESRKIDIFPKGLTHGFGPKVPIFSRFFFRQYRPGICLLRDFRTIKRLSRQ